MAQANRQDHCLVEEHLKQVHKQLDTHLRKVYLEEIRNHLGYQSILELPLDLDRTRLLQEHREVEDCLADLSQLILLEEVALAEAQHLQHPLVHPHHLEVFSEHSLSK